MDMWSDENSPSCDVSWCVTLARLHRPPTFPCRTAGFQRDFFNHFSMERPNDFGVICVNHTRHQQQQI